MSNYFFRGASLRDMIQNGSSTLTVPEYNLNMTYLQATEDYQKVSTNTLPYVINTNTNISTIKSLTGATSSVDASIANGDISIPSWANHYKFNFLGKGGDQGAPGNPGNPGRATGCPPPQATRNRTGGAGGAGGAGGNAYRFYSPLEPTQFSPDKTSTIEYTFSNSSSQVKFSPNTSITINSGAQGGQGGNGNNGSSGCQGGNGTPGAAGSKGAEGSVSNPNSIPGTSQDTGVITTTTRFEVYFFQL